MAKRSRKIDPLELSHAPDALPGGLKCVFSEKRTVKIGTGTTTRAHDMDVYWYVEQLGPEQFCMWSIGTNGLPVGDRDVISKSDLLSNFYPELRYYNEKVAPLLQEMLMAVERGDMHREKAEFKEAVHEYQGALTIDEGNVRAVFGLGISYLSRNDLKRARHTFNELINLEAAFTPEYKHLFNEMAISLRKSGLFAEAVGLYERAMDLTQEDENLLYNISRVYFDNGDWSNCLEFLGRCLQLDKTHRLARDMAQLLEKMVDDAKLRNKHGLPEPTPNQAVQAQRLFDS